VVLDGQTFRTLTPKQLDEILPNVEILADATIEDRVMFIQRLNGNNIPDNEMEWKQYHNNRKGKN
jgi:hypothetical protein